jgi:hypothetical protein
MSAPAPAKKTCANLTPSGIQTIAVIMKAAMYSQGYPGKPGGVPIKIPAFTIYGQDAIALSEIDGSAFAPPTPPASTRKAARRRRK